MRIDDSRTDIKGSLRPLPSAGGTSRRSADAMRENGNVVIADDWTIGDHGVKGKSEGKVFVPILDLFNAGAAADVGLDTMFPDAGENVRKYKTLITDDAG